MVRLPVPPLPHGEASFVILAASLADGKPRCTAGLSYGFFGCAGAGGGDAVGFCAEPAGGCFVEPAGAWAGGCCNGCCGAGCCVTGGFCDPPCGAVGCGATCCDPGCVAGC